MLRDWHTAAPRVQLSDERMDQIVAEGLAMVAARETKRGANCSCCGKPLTIATDVPTECPACVAMFS